MIFEKRNTLLMAVLVLFFLSTVCNVIIAENKPAPQNGQDAEDEGADNGEIDKAFSVYIQLRLNYVTHDGDYQDLKNDFKDAKDNRDANLEEIRDGIINYMDTFSASDAHEAIFDSISNTINLSADAWEVLGHREQVKRISNALHELWTGVLDPLGDRVQAARQDWKDKGGVEVIPPATFLCKGGGTCKVRYPEKTGTDTHHITCPYAPCATDGYQYWECQVSGRVCPRISEHTHIPSKSEIGLTGLTPNAPSLQSVRVTQEVGDTCVGCGELIGSQADIDTYHKQMRCPNPPDGCGELYWFCDYEDFDRHFAFSTCPAGHDFHDCIGHTCAATQKPLPCGHSWGSPGNHVLYSRCYTDSNCISTNFYLCQHTEHEYAEVPVCEHTPGHGKTTWSACGHFDYLCKARDHTTDLCPRSSSGETCTVNNGTYRVCIPHDHVYPSDSVSEGGASTPPGSNPQSTSPQQTTQNEGSENNNDDNEENDGDSENDDEAETEEPSNLRKSTNTENSETVNPRKSTNNNNEEDDDDDSEEPSNRGATTDTTTTTTTTQKTTTTPPKDTSDDSDEETTTTDDDSEEDDSDEETQQVLYEPCGVHVLGSPDSHRSVPCLPSASGVACEIGRYYACQEHTHDYKETTTQDDTSDTTEDDTSDTTQSTNQQPTNQQTTNTDDDEDSETNADTTQTIYCSSCRRAVSSANAHQTTCGRGHSYFSCNASQVSQHSGHNSSSNTSETNTSTTQTTTIYCSSCRRVVSSANAHQTTCGRGHSYFSCNASQVSQHSGHNSNSNANTSSPIVCPAHEWTNCRGTTSHATTCPAGHSYYSCNPTAVSSHANHSSSNNSSRVVCPANSWTNCRGTTSHATTCPAGHRYYSCNSSAAARHRRHTSSSSNTSSSNNSSSNNSSSNNSSSNNSSSNTSNSNTSTTQTTTIYCSGCWRAVSSSGAHVTTCGQGHRYYSCNASQVSTHRGHSSSSNTSSTNTSSSNNSSSNNSSSNNSSSNNSSSNNSSGNNTSGVVCARSGCDDIVASKYAHGIYCGAGHYIWGCHAYTVSLHSSH